MWYDYVVPLVQVTAQQWCLLMILLKIIQFAELKVKDISAGMEYKKKTKK